jgi:hypothetical protein
VGNFDELPRETILGMIDVNIRALTHLTHIAIPYMTRGSHIVQVASSAGYQPLGCFAVYAASKAYVISLSYALAAELRLKGIHTMVMAPGPVRTEFSSVSREDPTWHKAMLTKESDVRAVVAEALCDARKRKWASLYGFSNKLVPLLAALSPRRLMAIVSRTFIYVKVRRKD